MVKLLFGVFAAVFLVLGLMALGLSTSLIGGGAPSPDAQRDIPSQLLPVYQTAADSCPGLPWSVLAAIGKVETDHGRLQAPGVTSGANFAGAAGPMQIGIGGKAGNTFGAYAVDADGGGASVYNPVDAIFTAANYLCQNGANKGADVAGAIFAYNHADWYVTKVLAIASTYASSQGLPPGAPAEDVTAAAVQFAYNQLGIYIGAGNMIDAPYTGATVRITPFLRGDFIGAVRPTATAVPADGATATTATTVAG